MKLRIVAVLLFFVFFGGCFRSPVVTSIDLKCDQEGAEIFLNDKSYGQCPKNVVAPAGRYKVVIRKNLEDKSYWHYETQMKLAEGLTERLEAKLERVYTESYYYEKARKSSAVADYEEYLRKAPDGPHAKEMRQGLGSIRQRIEDELYEKAKDGKDPKALSAFLSKYPKSGRTGQLEARFKHLLGRNYTDTASGIEIVIVKGGCYEMGDADGNNHEKPVHKVCVNDFYIGKYEVTQGQWKAIMGSNPSKFKDCGDDCPVERVSYDEVQDFLRNLRDRTGTTYRLPTESEWEYAARSRGKKEKWAGTSDEGSFEEYAWSKANAESRTHPVGLKRPNGLGLCDMSGNVAEWVQDWYNDRYYEESPKDNPVGPARGDSRVLRGGSWVYDAGYLRTASRLRFAPDFRWDSLGFRVARSK